MAKISKIVKDSRKPKFSTQHRNRCKCCGRPRGYMRKFELCRLCFRKFAVKNVFEDLLTFMNVERFFVKNFFENVSQHESPWFNRFDRK